MTIEFFSTDLKKNYQQHYHEPWPRIHNDGRTVFVSPAQRDKEARNERLKEQIRLNS